MPVTIQCPCGQTLQVDDAQRGSKANCPACGRLLAIEDATTTGVQAEIPTKPRTAGGADDAPDAHGSIARPAAGRRSTPILLILGICGLLAILPCAGCVGVVALFFLRMDAAGVAAPAAIKAEAAQIDNKNKSKLAATQIKGLENAASAYFVKNARWPSNLKELTVKDEFGVQYLEGPEVIVDPWRNDYQFDAEGIMNQGERPDIWTVAPDGTKIGNWRKNGK